MATTLLLLSGRAVVTVAVPERANSARQLGSERSPSRRCSIRVCVLRGPGGVLVACLAVCVCVGGGDAVLVCETGQSRRRRRHTTLAHARSPHALHSHLQNGLLQFLIDMCGQ
jgi:hypothetical protein